MKTTQTAADLAREKLDAMLTAGIITPGDKLPAERPLTEQLGIYPRMRRFAVISKADAPDADVPAVRELLSTRGFEEPVLAINSLDPDDVLKVKQFLATADSQ